MGFKTSAGSRATTPSEKTYVYIRVECLRGRAFTTMRRWSVILSAPTEQQQAYSCFILGNNGCLPYRPLGMGGKAVRVLFPTSPLLHRGRTSRSSFASLLFSWCISSSCIICCRRVLLLRAPSRLHYSLTNLFPKNACAEIVTSLRIGYSKFFEIKPRVITIPLLLSKLTLAQKNTVWEESVTYNRKGFPKSKAAIVVGGDVRWSGERRGEGGGGGGGRGKDRGKLG